MSVDEERKVGMGARVDAAEGGAHPFLTAHFLTPPPVFVFNPRHSRRPWVHSLLVQKGGGACCFPSVSRSLSVATRTISNILDPFKGGGGCRRRVFDSASLPPPLCATVCRQRSATRQRDFDVRARDHPAIIRARCVDPFVHAATNNRISFYRLLSICTSISKKPFSFFLSSLSKVNRESGDYRPSRSENETEREFRRRRGSVMIRVERQPAVLLASTLPRLNLAKTNSPAVYLSIDTIGKSRGWRIRPCVFPSIGLNIPTLPDYYPIILSIRAKSNVDRTRADLGAASNPSIHLLMRIVWRVVAIERERERHEVSLSGGGMTVERGTVGSGRECRRRVRTRVKGVNARASRSHSLSKLEPEREQD